MRQLELIVGENAFRDGLREYLKRYAYGNATWGDLVRILDARTKRDLVQWSRAWVEERGRPTFIDDMRVNERSQLEGLDLMLDDPFDRGLVWPERLYVVLGYPERREIASPLTSPTDRTSGAHSTRTRAAPLRPAEWRRPWLRPVPAG